MKRQAYTYDDIQLVPSYSNVGSRKDISLFTRLSRHYHLCTPLVASCMDTVCESRMAIKMAEAGAVGCIHRFLSIEQQCREVAAVTAYIEQNALQKKWLTLSTEWKEEYPIPVMAAVGVNDDFAERAVALCTAGANIILIDVAHGHHELVQLAIAKLKEILPKHIDIIAGNIASAQAAIDLESWGADGLRVGVGGGSLCTTRLKTGFGVPNVTCLEDITAVTILPVMADGGIRTSGDIAKALALGAQCIMLGSLLAGTKESPGQVIEKNNGLFKRYRGAASLETKMVHGKEQRNVEGESTVIPFKGGVKFVLQGLQDGLRSALSYGGAQNLKQFKPDYVLVTNAGQTEAKPHLL